VEDLIVDERKDLATYDCLFRRTIQTDLMNYQSLRENGFKHPRNKPKPHRQH